MDAKELVSNIHSESCPLIFDVRSLWEYRSGHIPGAKHLPFWRCLFDRKSFPEDKNQRIIITCEHGPRARLSAGLLRFFGYSQVLLLEGHMTNWRRENYPLER